MSRYIIIVFLILFIFIIFSNKLKIQECFSNDALRWFNRNIKTPFKFLLIKISSSLKNK